MKRRKNQPITFSVSRNYVPIDEIPASAYSSPYDKIFKAALAAPQGTVAKVACANAEEAKLLTSRLYASSKGRLIVKHPAESRFVFVGPKDKPPARKKRR